MNGSNIGIRSNIYIRRASDYRQDPEYVSKITNKTFLRIIYNQQFGTLNTGVRLSAVQKDILDNKPCTQSKNEYSYGPVLRSGSLVWSCRCENEECPSYERCLSARYAKRIVREEEFDDKVKPERELSNLGITVSPSGAMYSKKREQEEYAGTYEKAAEPEPTEKDRTGYIKIGEPAEIIHADLNTHFLLNSAPGTGKTYTIIQRIIYILENHLCNPENIYILCYTRSAKKVIEDKIEDAVNAGRLYSSAKDICLFTFDSFATLFLSSIEEELQQDLGQYGYNERIALFNEYFPKYSADVDYFIIDEIQDLVNERAEMVLQILRNINSGYLLAGDKCQAIYDYEADHSANIDSSKFYCELEEFLPPDSRKYEVIGNRRQTEELADVSGRMRELILTKPPKAAESFIGELLSPYYEPNCVKEFIGQLSKTDVTNKSTAILCRSNYNSENINSMLCQRRIPHEFIRGVNAAKSLPRWIADVFWDFCDPIMSKETFIQRYQCRTDFCEDAPVVWESLCRLCRDDDADHEIDLSLFRRKLKNINTLPDVFFEEEPALKVSTIHKAKGSEFDTVYIADMLPAADNLSDEEMRIRYVGFTRAKCSFHYGDPIKYTGKAKHSSTGRLILAGRNRRSKSDHCSRVVIGLEGDIDSSFFVTGDFENAVAVQQYIAEKICQYDPLTIKMYRGKYLIFHNGRPIGALSSGMINEFRAAVSATSYNKNLPTAFKTVYVSKITTEILSVNSDQVASEFERSKICYGVEITGIATIEWNDGKSTKGKSK